MMRQEDTLPVDLLADWNRVNTKDVHSDRAKMALSAKLIIFSILTCILVILAVMATLFVLRACGDTFFAHYIDTAALLFAAITVISAFFIYAGRNDMEEVNQDIAQFLGDLKRLREVLKLDFWQLNRTGKVVLRNAAKATLEAQAEELLRLQGEASEAREKFLDNFVAKDILAEEARDELKRQHQVCRLFDLVHQDYTYYIKTSQMKPAPVSS